MITTISTKHAGYGQDILRAIESIHPEIICFDYFDTLVTRNVHPEDVKRIACERLARILNIPSAGQAIYRQRNTLETEICYKNQSAGNDLEFNFRSLFSALWEQEPACQQLGIERFIDVAVAVEISVECAVQIPDHETVNLLRHLHDTGRECWLISDFYMPSADFRCMLDHHGISDLFAQVHVSADTLLTKRSGRLYPRITAMELDQARPMIMIGDNEHSDGAMAVENGIPSIRLDRKHQHDHYQVLTASSNDIQLTERQIGQLLTESHGPFKELALTLYRYIDELHHRLVRSNAKDVFFMAREGQLLKQMFDWYQGHRKTREDCLIRSHYLEVSRRSTFLPSLKPLDDESFETLFRQYRRTSVEEFLSSLGLSYLVPQLAPLIPHSLTARMDDLPTSQAFSSLLHTPFFRDAYESERISRRDAFKTYLETFDLASDLSEMHFVDVGWKGTIQDNIYNIFAQIGGEHASRTLHGHYLGLIARGSESTCNIKYGVVFSGTPILSKNFAVFNENRALFEVALGADHGSAYSYQVDQSGTVRIHQNDFVEAPLFYAKVRPLQNQLFQLFQSIDRLLADQVFPSNQLELLAAKHHARMVFSPKDQEVEWFEDVYHVENFGVFETSTFKSVKFKSGMLDKIRFYFDLRRHSGDIDMGFWPWLTCLRRGGRLVATRYGRAQLRNVVQS